MQLDVKNSRIDYNREMDRINSTMNKKECTFGELEVIVYDIIDTLPRLDYNALHEEAQDMVVKTSDNPTTFQLLEQMDKVQQYKNRLGEIMTDVEHEYATRKRCMELLYAANNLSSNQKSVDKRQGEAMLRYPNLVLQFGRIESFRTELLNIMNNLKSVGDMISRQASIISMQMQLGEYRKKTSLDFNHGPEAEDVMDYKSGAPEIDWSDV